jgi:hypothetical protein
MSSSTSNTIWQVRGLDEYRYRAEFCCRGGPAGAFDVLLTPWLREVADLPPAGDRELVLCAVGVLLDRFLAAGLDVPPEVDLETLACADPAFVSAVQRRLGKPVPVES